jgi:hypothetical protein
MVVLNRPEKAREFLLEVTELDRCQLALFAALRRIVLKHLGHSLLGILWQQATHHDSFSAGVSAALPAACITQGLPAHPLLRLVGQPYPRKNLLPLCRFLLHQPPPATEASSLNQPTTWPCPLCQGPMYILERLTAAQILFGNQICVFL